MAETIVNGLFTENELTSYYNILVQPLEEENKVTDLFPFNQYEPGATVNSYRKIDSKGTATRGQNISADKVNFIESTGEIRNVPVIDYRAGLRITQQELQQIKKARSSNNVSGYDPMNFKLKSARKEILRAMKIHAFEGLYETGNGIKKVSSNLDLTSGTEAQKIDRIKAKVKSAYDEVSKVSSTLPDTLVVSTKLNSFLVNTTMSADNLKNVKNFIIDNLNIKNYYITDELGETLSPGAKERFLLYKKDVNMFHFGLNGSFVLTNPVKDLVETQTMTVYTQGSGLIFLQPESICLVDKITV